MAADCLVASLVLAHRKVVQATALLALVDGASVRSTAKVLQTYPNTVAAWRDRFVESGVDGIGVIASGRVRKPEISSAARRAWPVGLINQLRNHAYRQTASHDRPEKEPASCALRDDRSVSMSGLRPIR